MKHRKQKGGTPPSTRRHQSKKKGKPIISHSAERCKTMTTTNLSDFGYRELEMLEELLKAMREQGLPDDFYDEEVHPMMNQNSGNVFLTNSEYQVAMMNGDKLESWYFLSYHGNEGFLDELIIDYDNGNIQEEDWEQLADICEANGEEEKAEEIRNRLNEE